MSKIFMYHKNKYELTEDEISKSPYLLTLTTTDVNVEKDEEGNILLHLDVSPSGLQNYINYLKGRAFFLSNEDLDFFDYMGHDNYYEFNAEYWKSILEGTRHNVCGDLVDKIETIQPTHTLKPLDTLFNGIDLYYISDTALLSCGIISKPSSLSIVYHLKDKNLIHKALKVPNGSPTTLTVDITLETVALKHNNTPYRTFEPSLRSDGHLYKATNPDKIWNGKTIPCTLYGMDFDCMENLLYILPADTDGIVMHVKSGVVHKTLALVKSYRSYVTRTVNLIPEYLHHHEYLLRLCNLSLMGFKINVPKFNDIAQYDEYKMERLIKRSNAIMEDNRAPYSSKVTYLLNPIASKELRISIEDYVALLQLGPTRPPYRTEEIPGKYYKKDIDINELYSLSQIVEDNNLIEYQYSKHEFNVYDGMYYKIGRIDTYNIDSKKKYIVGRSLLEAMKCDTIPIKHNFYSELPDLSHDIIDQCYCNIETGIVYASIPLINALYNKDVNIKTKCD